MSPSDSQEHGHSDVLTIKIFWRKRKNFQVMSLSKYRVAHCRLLARFEFQRPCTVGTTLHQIQVRIEHIEEPATQLRGPFRHLHSRSYCVSKLATVGLLLLATYKRHVHRARVNQHPNVLPTQLFLPPLPRSQNCVKLKAVLIKNYEILTIFCHSA